VYPQKIIEQSSSDDQPSESSMVEAATHYTIEGNRVAAENGLSGALLYWREIYKQENNQPKLQAFSLYQSALIQRAMGRLKPARNNLRLAIAKLDKQQNAASLLAPILASMGSVELELGNYKSAKDVLEDSRVIAVSLADRYNIRSWYCRSSTKTI
jgi:tetratricopeptide (TPR) repeat protein